MDVKDTDRSFVEQLLPVDEYTVTILVHSLVFMTILVVSSMVLFYFTYQLNSIRDVSMTVNLTRFFEKLDIINLILNLPIILINALVFDILPTQYQLNYLQRALLAGIIVSMVAAIVGTFVLLRGLVFLGQAIAHSAFAGAAFAILLGEIFTFMDTNNGITTLLSTPVIMISVFAVVSALGIGYVNEKEIMRNEVIVGIVFSFFMAMAVLFIGLLLSYSTEVNSILFGNLLLISTMDFRVMFWLSIIIVSVLLALKKEFYFITFDSELARLSGIPVRFLRYLFLLIVSLTIAVTLQAIGAILVFAMLITPAAAAYQWTFRLNKLLILSAIFGVFSNFFGLYLSYLIDLPSSSTIVFVISLIFVYSFVVSPKRKSSGKSGDLCSYCSRYIVDETGYCEDDAVPVPHKHVDDHVLIYRDDLEQKEEV